MNTFWMYSSAGDLMVAGACATTPLTHTTNVESWVASVQDLVRPFFAEVDDTMVRDALFEEAELRRARGNHGWSMN